ncbi:hypothetical protein HIM_04885 [Hirsutella minnesotensis 3608]|uniref:Uncharacterized protein n=1 Tax=Hirsutella minnesotensis 3608 TaxID=1043627 RepID=A0A0F7ZUZ6_9HYPO|nr:hypothetical protein HIM_04885 [Hirsutella minnesotensis 3608]
MEAPAAHRLPSEILFHIIQSLKPQNPHMIFPRRSDTTQTLLALARVSHAFYAQAASIIRQHCMYLDSGRRVAMLAKLLLRNAFPNRHQVTQAYISQFAENTESREDLQDTRPMRDFLYERHDNNELETFLEMLSPNLRRLIYRGFQSLLDDLTCRGRLSRPYFTNLRLPQRYLGDLGLPKSLEEFVYIQEDRCVESEGAQDGNHGFCRLLVLPRFNLKRVAIWGENLDCEELWLNIVRLACLETLVLSFPPTLLWHSSDGRVRDVDNVAAEYKVRRRALRDLLGGQRRDKELDVMEIHYNAFNEFNGWLDESLDDADHQDNFDNGGVRFSLVNVSDRTDLTPCKPFLAGGDCDKAVANFYDYHALEGDLFDGEALGA